MLVSLSLHPVVHLTSIFLQRLVHENTGFENSAGVSELPAYFWEVGRCDNLTEIDVASLG